MSYKLLLPHKFKKPGWILLIVAFLLGIIQFATHYQAFSLQAPAFAIVNEEILGSDQYFSLISTNIANTLLSLLFIAGGLLVGFSREKNEDEYISSLRQSSLLWAVLVNYILLFLSFVFIFGVAFLTVMLFNIYTVLIIYIARFNYILYRNSKSGADEK